MSRTDPQFNLRIPADLKERVEQAAKQSKRSATAEIIARLEQSFAEEAATPRLTRGVDKQLLLESIKNPLPGLDAYEAIDRAIEALQAVKIRSSEIRKRKSKTPTR